MKEGVIHAGPATIHGLPQHYQKVQFETECQEIKNLINEDGSHT